MVVHILVSVQKIFQKSSGDNIITKCVIKFYKYYMNLNLLDVFSLGPPGLCAPSEFYRSKIVIILKALALNLTGGWRAPPKPQKCQMFLETEPQRALHQDSVIYSWGWGGDPPPPTGPHGFFSPLTQITPLPPPRILSAACGKISCSRVAHTGPVAG
jgi:hypothetical protein